MAVAIFNICQRITWEGIEIIEFDKVFEPTCPDYTARLRSIPELIYDLCAGRIEYVDQNLSINHF